MENEKLTKSKVWRETDKFTDTVSSHWFAYIEYPGHGLIDEHGRKYPAIPSYADLCNDFEDIMPLETISDYVFDTNDIEIAKSLIEMMGLCHDLMKSTANYQAQCKDETLLEDCYRYTALMRKFVVELDNLEDHLTTYNDSLEFAHRPEWGYTDEMRLAFSGKTSSDGENDLPKELATDLAMKYWPKAKQAGFVNDDYSFNGTRYQMAYFAEKFSLKLGLKPKWKPFAKLWNYEKFSSTRYESKERIGYVEKQEEIDQIFKD